MSRKLALIGMSVMCFTLCISGVVFAGGKQESSSTSAAQPVKLEIWRTVREPVWTQYFKDVCNAFNKSHPGIEVTTVEFDNNQFDTKLNTAYAAGTAPEMVSTGIYNIPYRAGTGQFYAIDKYFDSWSKKSDFIQSMVDLGKYKGHLYGVPFFPDPKLFFYRKDYFEAAGLDPNAPPKTWSQLAEYAKKLTVVKDGKVTREGFDINSKDYYVLETLIYQNGGHMVDYNTDMPVWDSPEAIGALAFLTKLYNMHVSFPVSGGSVGNIFRNPFYTGQAAMAFASMYGVESVIENDPTLKDKIAIAPPLKERDEATFTGLNFNFISSSAQHKDMDWEFFKFFMSNDQTWKRYKLTTVPPVFKSLKQQYLADNPQNKVIWDSIQVGRGNPKVTWSRQNQDFLVQAIEESFFGKKTPVQAMTENVAALKKELKSTR